MTDANVTFNLLGLELEPSDDGAPAGHRFAGRAAGWERGAKLTGLGLYEVEPGQSTWPYHFELVEEEWLLVIAGRIVLRTPDGDRELRAGDVACFPPGPAGAHAVRNESDETARFAMPSSLGQSGGGAVYVDSGKFAIGSGGFRHRGRLGEQVEYWEGEP
jgi:uncharacterized cupin superfamily protein